MSDTSIHPQPITLDAVCIVRRVLLLKHLCLIDEGMLLKRCRWVRALILTRRTRGNGRIQTLNAPSLLRLFAHSRGI
jgi:hypothetical protein